MATKQRADGAILPNRLYTYEQLAEISGLTARRLRRMTTDGRLGYQLVGREKRRMVRGQQYLDWLERTAVEPDEDF